MVHGSTDCSCSQLVVSLCRIFGVSEGLGKTTDKFCSVGRDEGFEVWFLVAFDGFEEDEPSSPGRSPLLVRLSCDGFFAGIFSSHA